MKTAMAMAERFWFLSLPRIQANKTSWLRFEKGLSVGFWAFSLRKKPFEGDIEVTIVLSTFDRTFTK